MTITDHLIALAAGNVPTPASEMMRLSLFDWAACGISGAQEADFTPFVDLHRSQGGTPEASIVGGGQVPAPVAALLNGTLSHALDYDDTHFAHIGHPSVAVLPAVLALGERSDASFEALLEAATLGVEASIHTGLWLGRAHYQVGYHQTATAGAFGATLGAAKLLKLNPDQTRTALGLCASLASGLKAQFGTMAKPLNAGLAARAGVEAALWAHAGITAAPDGLAGPLGFGPTHHGTGDESHFGEMGQGNWQIESISHKFHACCHGLHAMLEALSKAEYQPTIDTITIRTHPRWMSVCNIDDPQTGLAAKFSYKQTAAMALLGYKTGAISNFTDAIAQSADVKALRNRVTVVADDRLTETQSEVLITSGGHPNQHLRHDLLAPLTIEARTTKLHSKATALLGEDRAKALWAAIALNDLPGLKDQLVRS